MVMKKRKEEQNRIDPNLDIPSEANRNKHINFSEVEEESANTAGRNKDDFSEERRRQWEKGLKEGKEAREK
jgi:hypothetical protein